MPTVLEVIVWLSMAVAALGVGSILFAKVKEDVYLSKEALRDYQDEK